jgi:hypothetical protein
MVFCPGWFQYDALTLPSAPEFLQRIFLDAASKKCSAAAKSTENSRQNSLKFTFFLRHRHVSGTSAR